MLECGSDTEPSHITHFPSRTRGLDKLSAQCDDPVALASIGDPCSLIQILGHQCVSQRKVEGWPQRIISHLDQVKQARHVLWSEEVKGQTKVKGQKKTQQRLEKIKG